MKRRIFKLLFNLLAGVSLLVCVAAVVLWAWSYRGRDDIYWASVKDRGHKVLAASTVYQGKLYQLFTGGPLDHTTTGVVVSQGGVELYTWATVSRTFDYPIDGSPPGNPGIHWRSYSRPKYPSANPQMNHAETPILGFFSVIQYRRIDDRSFQESYHAVIFPIWSLCALCSVLPAIWFNHLLQRWHRARFRLRVGLCLKCGYDLRATPDRCPECGSIPPVKGVSTGK